MAASGSQDNDPGSEQSGTPLLEWIVGGISGLLVLAILAFIVIEGLVREDHPPDLRVVADSVVPVAAGYLLLFTIHNDGGETAAQVQISGALRQGGANVEESQAVFDYVPIAARNHGALQFQHDPREMEVELRVTGFAEP